MIGTLIGAIFLAVLGNGLAHLGVASHYGDMIKGGMMIFGVLTIAMVRNKTLERNPPCTNSSSTIPSA